MNRIKRLIKSYDVVLLLMGSLCSYLPLSMFTKMAGKGFFASQEGVPAGVFEILPLYTIGNIIASVTFFYVSGWWRLMSRHRLLGFSICLPRWYTILSGLCVIVQIFTVLWAYANAGISTVFAALLMKGGVLFIAPTVDLTMKSKGRRIYWPSWAAASLSFIALAIASSDGERQSLSFILMVDVVMYLISYFIRLSIMSRWAKNDKAEDKKRYIVEEQITIIAMMVLILVPMACAGVFMPGDNALHEVFRGFVVLPSRGFIVIPMIIGVAAVSAGFFGTLVFLDRRENTFCVSAVHSMSVIAGTIATALLAAFYSQPPLDVNKMVGVVLIIVAIVFLSYRGVVEKKHVGQLDNAVEDGAEV